MERRTFLSIPVAGLASLTLGSTMAMAGGDQDWRMQLITDLSGVRYRSYSARQVKGPVGSPLECIEIGDSAYFIIDPATREYLEFSSSCGSPFAGATDDAYYFGPGQVFSRGRGDFQNCLTGQIAPPAFVAAAEATITQVASETRSNLSPRTADGRLAPRATPYTVADPKYIWYCHIYKNTNNCGYIAGSILTRYWHARHQGRNLVPRKYRSGTNLTPSPNYAVYLQDFVNAHNPTSWARDLYYALHRNAQKQGSNANVTWVASSVGVKQDIRLGRPVILFGNIPVINGSGNSNHAILANGIDRSGGYRVHYGYMGKHDVVLNGGLIGSSTFFSLR